MASVLLLGVRVLAGRAARAMMRPGAGRSQRRPGRGRCAGLYGRLFGRARRSGYSSHMKTATLTEAKNQLSALIDLVRHGETIVITDRGRPVARLVSALTGAAEDP